jgi:phosphoribosylformylglycinamidine synthase
MPRVIVDVMPKPEILDPQGQAIARALPSLGFDTVTSVRQGKRFEIEVADGSDPLDIARRAAEAMLANPVIEDFTVHVADS